ncbi:Forkhead transcription factor [Hypoxylon texense]
MEQQAPQEFILEAFADPASVRDVVRGILHTIFFHRFFPSLRPRSREVLDITLPFVDDAELDTMIEKRAAELARELDAERSNAHSHSHSQTHSHSHASHAPPAQTRGGSGGGRGNIQVQFFEKKRRKAWYMRAAYGSGDEEVCWESWTVKVTVAEPRTDSERAKVRKAMEQTLLTTVMKIVTCVNTHKDHIPPITTSEANPFPYQINVNQKDAGWATRMGIY